MDNVDLMTPEEVDGYKAARGAEGVAVVGAPKRWKKPSKSYSCPCTSPKSLATPSKAVPAASSLSSSRSTERCSERCCRAAPTPATY